MIEYFKSDFLYFECFRHDCHAFVRMSLADALNVEKGESLKCPGCGIEKEADREDFQRFLKFYSRLRLYDEVLVKVVLVELNAANHSFADYGESTAKFECGKCHHQFTLTLSRVKKISLEPALYRCPKCKENSALLKDLKEYFMCIRWVLQLSSFVQGFRFLPKGAERDGTSSRSAPTLQG